MRVRTYGFPGCLTRPPGTSTRDHPCEPTTSKPVVPRGCVRSHSSRTARPAQAYGRADRRLDAAHDAVRRDRRAPDRRRAADRSLGGPRALPSSRDGLGAAGVATRGPRSLRLGSASSRNLRRPLRAVKAPASAQAASVAGISSTRRRRRVTGWIRSAAGRIPSLAATRSERALPGSTTAITRARPSGPKASVSAAPAPSVARPRPHASRASRHPTSTAGRTAGRNDGIASPTKPRQRSGSARAAAHHSPKPCAAQCARIRSSSASLCARVSGRPSPTCRRTLGVGVERGEGIGVGPPPSAQHEPSGCSHVAGISSGRP